jgi:transposase InsO family protein
LRREGWTVNHKRVERLMRAAGLHIDRKAKRRTTHELRNEVVEEVNS